MVKGWAAGLVLALGTGGAAAAASFDCDAPGLAMDEQAICATRDLNDADVEVATMLRLLAGLFAMGQRGAMMDAQQVWLEQRKACGADLACLRAAYAQRRSELDAVYQAIDRPL